jgi:hypothetical protein
MKETQRYCERNVSAFPESVNGYEFSPIGGIRSELFAGALTRAQKRVAMTRLRAARDQA